MNSAWTRKLTDSLTRRAPSIALGCIAGAWAFYLSSIPPADSNALWAGSFLPLLYITLAWWLFWPTPESVSGPTTLPTTVILRRTKGWRSVGSRTRCSGSGSPSLAAVTTDSRTPKWMSSGTRTDPAGWTWCPIKSGWSTPEGFVSEAAYVVGAPVARRALLHSWLRTVPGARIHGLSGCDSCPSPDWFRRATRLLHSSPERNSSPSSGSPPRPDP